MSGVGDMSNWVESLAESLEAVSKVTSDLTEQVMANIREHEIPPVVVEAYKSGTAMVEGINPVYLGAGAVAISGFLVLACGCRATPKKSKISKTSGGSKGKKKSKPAKSKSTAVNGVPHENDGGRAVDDVLPTKNGGRSNGTTVLPGGNVKSNGKRKDAAADPSHDPEKPRAEKPVRPKAAEKPIVKAPHSQEKTKRKPAADAPPVITEEIEGAKKRTRKKKPAKTVNAPAVVPPPKKSNGKGSGSSANGSSRSGAAGSRSEQNNEGSAGVDSHRGTNGSGGNGDWQTRFIGPLEGEWETVSHKKSKPRKDKTSATASNDASVIPGGLGL